MILKNLIAASFLSFCIAPNAYSNDDGAALFKKVTTAAQACAESNKGSSEATFCWIKATPKKCEPHVTTYISSMNKSDAMRAWYICVASCASSGFWSNHFGECSRDIK